MGMFFTNCHVRTSDKSSCVKALRRVIHSRALVTEPKNGWLTIYDETSESQDIEELIRLAKGISSKLKTAAFGFLVHDSDIFVYVLYDNGKFVDQFDSHPGCLGPVTDEHRKEWAGHFDRLLKFAARRTTVDAIKKVLAKPQLVEEERAAQFASLMGIDRERAQTGFKYAQRAANNFQLVYAPGYTARDAELVAAVSKKDVSTVRALLDKGVSPNQEDSHGNYSLLVSAIQTGRSR